MFYHIDILSQTKNLDENKDFLQAENKKEFLNKMNINFPIFHVCRYCLYGLENKDMIYFFDFKMTKGRLHKRINFKSNINI